MATTPFPTSATSSSSAESRERLDASSDAGRTEAQRAEDARRLAERVAQNAHAVIDRAVDRLVPAVDRIKSRVSEASTAIHRSADQISEMQDRWIDDSRSSIRSHPLSWVVTAFAVGMVIGRIQSGR